MAEELGEKSGFCMSLEVQLKNLKLIGLEGQVMRWTPDWSQASGLSSWYHFLRGGRVGKNWVESKLPFEMHQSVSKKRLF